MYADDVQLYLDRPMGLREDCICRLNDDLKRISEWAKRNQLLLNPKKSTSMLIHRLNLDLTDISPIVLNNTVLPFVSSVRNLGIQLNHQLTCCSHVSSVLGKVYACLRQLRMSARFLARGVRLRLAKALVLPHFTFGSLVYSKLDAECNRRLNVAFNDTIRYIHGLRRFSHISPFIDSFVGCSLETYLTRRRLKFLHSLVIFREPSYLLDHIQFLTSDRHRNILLPRFRTQIGERSYFVQTIRNWNSLPVTLQRTSSHAMFNRLLGLQHVSLG